MPTERPSDRSYSVFAPLALLLLAMVLWFALQTWQLVMERKNLAAFYTGQETMFQNAQKMRSQLDAIAAGAARLAEKGNPNAQAIVDALRARGVTINPNAAREPAK